MAELSILIPARNEEWLKRTVEDIFEHIEGDTEVIVGLDGYIDSDVYDLRERYPNLRIICYEEARGQRAMTNKLAEMSEAKYLMKVDAHCSFSQGFDVEMMKVMEDDMTLVPSLLNLHVFDWVCECGARHEQGVEPKECWKCKGDRFHKDVVWKLNHKPIMTDFAFDSNLIFQYTDITKEGDLTETMSIQGCGFMVTRDKYWELELGDQGFKSWGQQGTEIGCKTWLSGGKVMCTKNTYMGHFFRTPTGFPYEMKYEDIKHNQEYSRDLFLNNKWPKQVESIQWLIEKFGYPLDWTPEKVQELCKPWN
jgi:glycosyltransferase involved in cell wall biosynthesis